MCEKKESENMKEQNVLSPYQHQDDEIDLKELFLALWKGKWIILLTTLAFSVGGVFYALSQPNVYKAQAVLASTSDSGGGGLSALASQFGGLASLAGVSLGGGSSDDKTIALATLKSRRFINAFIDKYDLAVPLIAGKVWHENDDYLELDPKVYSKERKLWIEDEVASVDFTPTAWDEFKAFSKVIEVSESKDTGLVTISITHFSPTIAKEWVDKLVIELNAWMKNKALSEANKNIGYLETQIERTNILDMQSVFYQLIEEQTKSLMLAEVQEEFAFEVIDPAVVPEEKNGPKRALISVITTLVGGLLGALIVLVRFAFKQG